MSNTKVQVEYELLDRISGTLAKVNASIDGTTAKLSQAENPVQSFGNSWTGLATKLLAAGALMKAGQYLYDFGKGSIMAASQIETYKTSLVNMLGTQEAANKRMAEYQDISQKTPFELPQVVEAGNQLQALGKYSRENIVMLGDLASASGKPIEQAMSAYAKMATGQKGIAVDMFRDLMITADDWQKATGKGISKNGELLASTTELLAVIPTILKKKGFAGMMDAQSKTAKGMASNMSDAAFQMSAAIGERLMPTVKNATGAFTDMFNSMQSVFEMSNAEKISNEKMHIDLLTSELTNSNTPLDRRLAILKELNQIAPDVVKGIDAEKVSISQLTENLIEYNKNAYKRIYIAQNNEVIGDLMKKVGSSMKTRFSLDSEINEGLSKSEKTARATGHNGVADKLTEISLMNGDDPSTKVDAIKKVLNVLKNGKKIDPLYYDLVHNLPDITLVEEQIKALKGDEGKINNEAQKQQARLNAWIKKNGSGESDTTGIKPTIIKPTIIKPTKTGGTGGNSNDDTKNNTIFSADPTSGKATSITIKVDKIIGIENLNTKEIKEATPVMEREIVGAIVRSLNSANGM